MDGWMNFDCKTINKAVVLWGKAHLWNFFKALQHEAEMSQSGEFGFGDDQAETDVKRKLLLQSKPLCMDRSDTDYTPALSLFPGILSCHSLGRTVASTGESKFLQPLLLGGLSFGNFIFHAFKNISSFSWIWLGKATWITWWPMAPVRIAPLLGIRTPNTFGQHILVVLSVISR